MIKIDMQKRNLFRRKSDRIAENLMPWISNTLQLTENCTQCKSCIEQCPENIITNGDGGFPIIDFSLGECIFCGQCAENCQENVFDDTHQIPWQKKAIIDDSCLAHQNVFCRSCGESCGEEALTFQIGINAPPQIDLEKCNGCGACFSPCPTNAISIKETE